MSIKDLTGLEKPLQKLIEVVSEGVGTVANHLFEFDVRKLKRIGDAESEKEKIAIIKRAEGSATALEILGRAQNRLALEQYSKQINLENIIVKTRELLEGQDVSEEPVEKDWSSRFVGIAQEVSREDVQEMLAKILSEEIKRPNSFSLRTLEFVRNLSKAELLLFRRAAIISADNAYVFLDKNNANAGFSGFTYTEVMKLIELGLIQSSLSTELSFKGVTRGKTYNFRMKRGLCSVHSQEDLALVKIPLLRFTSTGVEIASLIDIESGDAGVLSTYESDLNAFWALKKLAFTVSILE